MMESMAFRPSPVAIGYPVYAADGEQVGEVKAVQNEYFEVDVEGAPDYWLPMTAIATAETARVHLRYPAELVSRMAVPPPDEEEA
jgi:hypothetical protein